LSGRAPGGIVTPGASVAAGGTDEFWACAAYEASKGMVAAPKPTAPARFRNRRLETPRCWSPIGSIPPLLVDTGGDARAHVGLHERDPAFRDANCQGKMTRDPASTPAVIARCFG